MNRVIRVAALSLALGLAACGNDQAPVGLTYTLNPATYVAGTAIASNQAITTGGTPSSFSISPALPAGLAFSLRDRRHHRHAGQSRRRRPSTRSRPATAAAPPPPASTWR